jgi:hypothetical protein
MIKYGENLVSVCHCFKRESSKSPSAEDADTEYVLKNESFQENPLEKYIQFSYIPEASAIKRPKLTGPARRFFATGFSKASVFPKF